MKAGIQAIIQKINADADELVRERHMQAKADAESEIESENALRREEYEKRRELLSRHNDRERKRLLERFDRRLSRDISAFQHSLVNEIFDMAVSKLRGVSKEEFSKMFKASIKGLEGKFTVYVGELSEGKLDEKTVEDAAKAEKGLEIALSPDLVPQKSGFALRDDRVEYNCLFEDLIEVKKNEQIAGILKEVFAD